LGEGFSTYLNAQVLRSRRRSAVARVISAFTTTTLGITLRWFDGRLAGSKEPQRETDDPGRLPSTRKLPGSGPAQMASEVASEGFQRRDRTQFDHPANRRRSFRIPMHHMEEVYWHSLRSPTKAASLELGEAPSLIEALNRREIPFVIYPPSTSAQALPERCSPWTYGIVAALAVALKVMPALEQAQFLL
jgi:hypothetical protein